MPLYFSHGFSVVYGNTTGIIPPKNVDVILVAPKGSGTSVRRNFLEGSGINSSFAVYQDYARRAHDRVKAIGIAIGSGYLFPTTFEHEVYSNLTGERGVLLGAIAGLMEARIQHPEETRTQPKRILQRDRQGLHQRSLIRLVDENGMDLDVQQLQRNRPHRSITMEKPLPRQHQTPLLDSLYELVVAGEETRIVLERSKAPDYKRELSEELAAMGNSELWKTGATVSSDHKDKKPKVLLTCRLMG